jgi:magnesium transporter
LKDYISVTSDWISYALIDDITDAFGPLIQSIEYEVDSIDELVLIIKDAEQSDMLRRYVYLLSDGLLMAESELVERRSWVC